MKVNINEAPHQNCIFPKIVLLQYGKVNHFVPKNAF